MPASFSSSTVISASMLHANPAPICPYVQIARASFLPRAYGKHPADAIFTRRYKQEIEHGMAGASSEPPNYERMEVRERGVSHTVTVCGDWLRNCAGRPLL